MNDRSDLPTRINLTGQNVLIAFVLAIICITALTIIYGLMGVALDLMDNRGFEFEVILWRGVNVIRGLGLCVVPVVFIVAFALLQRFRNK